MKTLAWMMRNRTLLANESAVKAEPKRRLVVVEHATESIERLLDGAEFQETIVVAESGEDSGPSLALRVAGRIAQLEQRHTPVCSATLVVGQGHGSQVAAARELIARSLLSHLKSTGGTELAILAPSPSDGAPDDLLALVDHLLCELDTQSITVRLRFGGRREPRGPASEPALSAAPLRVAS